MRDIPILIIKTSTYISELQFKTIYEGVYQWKLGGQILWKVDIEN